MTWADAVAYALALGLAAAIPGPGITALVARSVGTGSVGGYAMLGGLICGDMVYLSFAVFGLALIADSMAGAFIVIKGLSIVWLLCLAWQFWTAQHHDLGSREIRTRDLAAAALSGFTITLANPKAMAFYVALLPAVIDIRTVTVSVWAGVLLPLTALVLLVVGSVYVLGAISVRRQLSSGRAQRRLHRGAALAMAAASGSLLLREL